MGSPKNGKTRNVRDMIESLIADAQTLRCSDYVLLAMAGPSLLAAFIVLPWEIGQGIREKFRAARVIPYEPEIEIPEAPDSEKP